MHDFLGFINFKVGNVNNYIDDATSSIIGVFSDENSARQVLGKLPAEWSGFVAKGVNMSPLQQKLKYVNEASDMN